VLSGDKQREPVLPLFRSSNIAIEQLQLCHKNVTALSFGKKVLCSMAAEGKSVSNSRSLCNIHWIYPAQELHYSDS